MKTLLLTGDDVRRLLTPELAITAVEDAFRAHGRGETIVPPKVYLPLEDYGGDFRGMPVYMDGHAGIKWVNAHPHNPSRHGLPSVLAVFILSDPATAAPLAIMDATSLTAMRTGAAAAVATKYLGRGGARSVGIIGCGAQARTVIACLSRVIEIEELFLHDRSETIARALAVELATSERERAVELATSERKRALELTAARVAPLEQAAGAEVVCTLTPSRAPIVPRSAIRDGAHVNAMGADAPGKQELDAEILADARVFVDDWKQGCESGEVNVPLAKGRLRREDIAASLGEVIAGMKPGRRSPADITVFDSTGLAVQDLAVAREVYAKARAQGLGVEFELMRP